MGDIFVKCGLCGGSTALPRRHPNPIVINGEYTEPILVGVRCASCGEDVPVPPETDARVFRKSLGMDDPDT